MLNITDYNDIKLTKYLNKVQLLQLDLSCFIFDQLCHKPNVDVIHQKKLFFNLAYLWLRVTCHLKNISSNSNSIWQWNENCTFLLKFVTHYIVKKENRMLKNLEPQEFVFCFSNSPDYVYTRNKALRL